MTHERNAPSACQPPVQPTHHMRSEILMNAVVVIPTYNERENLVELTTRLLNLPVNLHVLYVDDDSPDGTGKLADELCNRDSRVSVLHRAGPRGFSAALLAGLKSALAGSYDRILTMDADLSHDPAAIPHLLDAAQDYGLVIGSRYVHGVRIMNWDMHRLLLSWVANRYARAITRFPHHDMTSGFRCYRRAVLEAIPLDRIKTNGYGFQIEVAYHIWKANNRIVERPITFYGREKGVSKMSKRMIVESAMLVWRLRFSAPIV
jgi:dolichol-phosphate mannosyltransferase